MDGVGKGIVTGLSKAPDFWAGNDHCLRIAAIHRGPIANAMRIDKRFGKNGIWCYICFF
jgi:hypothetical protein